MHIVLQLAIQYAIIITERQELVLATKSANVTARIQLEIKQQAEAVLEKLGLPVSVLIDTLYRQIIMTGGVPYALSVPKLPTRDTLTDAQFDIMMETGYNQAKADQGISVEKPLRSFVRVFACELHSKTDTLGCWTDFRSCRLHL